MLNEKQQQVVDELSRNVLLLASAGTGKTATLSNRIDNILKNGLAIDKEILCVTFTNKACKEMKDRISSLSGDIAKGVEISTFHGLCYNIIKSEAKKNTDVYTGFTVFDEEDCLSLLKEFLEENVSAKDIKKMVDFIRESIIRFEIFSDDKRKDYEEVVNRVSQDEEMINKFLSSFKHNSDVMRRIFQMYGGKYTERYTELLRQSGALDFQDLINLTYELFLDEDVVNRYSKKYKFINIDEMQDTSLVEYSIIEKIFKNNNVLLCGDSFQTIYGWRGSDPKAIFDRFKAKYNPIEVYFDCNYRATKVLTESSVRYLEKAFPREVAELFKDGLKTFSSEEGDKILIKEAYDLEGECMWIYRKILSLPEEERQSTCILSRDNSHTINLSSTLREISENMNNPKEKLDFALIDDSKFFRKTEVKDVIAFLKLIANKTDEVSLKRIIKRFPYKIGEVTLSKIESKEYKENGIHLNDLIDKNALENMDKFESLTKALEDNNIIVFDVESTGTDTTRDEIIQIAAIKIDSDGNEIDRFMKFLKPNKPVGSSEAVHGFSDEYLEENGEEKVKVLKEFLGFIKDTVIVGHNVQYDINILASELERNKLPKAEFTTFYDTLDIYRRFYPSLENHKLDTISKFVNTKHSPNHNALYDILATGEILVHAVKNNIVPTSSKRKELMQSIPDRFDNLSKHMNDLFESSKCRRPSEIIQMVVKAYKIIESVGKDTLQADTLRELYFVAKHHDDLSLSPRDSLLDFVRITALTDGEMEKLLRGKGKIPIITVHQAKGLEFENLFISGMQDSIFPNYFSCVNHSYEEEKKVFYVAITRAKKRLFLSYCTNYKKRRYQKRSMLINFLDKKYIKED